MATNGASTQGLIAFNGSNFKEWSNSVEDVCLLNGVWQSLVRAPVITEGKKLEDSDLNKTDQVCLGILKRSLCDKFNLVKDGYHPFFVFKKAKELFGKKTVNNAFFINQKFHDCQMQSDETLVNFLDRMNLLRNELSGTKYEISDEAVIVKVMGSADAHWSDFFRSWRREHSSDENMDFDDFRVAIQEEEHFSKQLRDKEPLKNIFYANQQEKNLKQFKKKSKNYKKRWLSMLEVW